MPDSSFTISSPQNPRVKSAVRLRRRSHRDESGLMLIEGYREVKRALDNGHVPIELFVCEDFFIGKNEPALIQACSKSGAEIHRCTRLVFEKIAYRDRPEGLVAIAPQLRLSLTDVVLSNAPLVVVAEATEKPGNLGTILRSADAAGVECVLVCDRCTDISNPNVVRASIGTLFSLPVVEVSSEQAILWLHENNIRAIAATPHAQSHYFEADFAGPTAIVVGTEQYGLSDVWLQEADLQVRIPMLGQADSLNVASATTILLYEAMRQRHS